MDLGTLPRSWHHKEAFEQGLLTTDAILGGKIIVLNNFTGL